MLEQRSYPHHIVRTPVGVEWVEARMSPRALKFLVSMALHYPVGRSCTSQRAIYLCRGSFLMACCRCHVYAHCIPVLVLIFCSLAFPEMSFPFTTHGNPILPLWLSLKASPFQIFYPTLSLSLFMLKC